METSTCRERDPLKSDYLLIPASSISFIWRKMEQPSILAYCLHWIRHTRQRCLLACQSNLLASIDICDVETSSFFSFVLLFASLCNDFPSSSTAIYWVLRSTNELCQVWTCSLLSYTSSILHYKRQSLWIIVWCLIYDVSVNRSYFFQFVKIHRVENLVNFEPFWTNFGQNWLGKLPFFFYVRVHRSHFFQFVKIP